MDTIYVGKLIYIGIMQKDWGGYTNQIEDFINNNKDLYHPQYLKNVREILLDNYSVFSGNATAIIYVDAYSCLVTIKGDFFHNGDTEIHVVNSKYVYPFDIERRYPIQRIETKTTWKY